MKKFIYLFASFICSVLTNAQNVGIGTTTPQATFDVKGVGSSRVDLQACKLEYSIVSPK